MARTRLGIEAEHMGGAVFDPLSVGGSGVSAVSIRRTLSYGEGWMPYAMAGTYDAAALRRTMRFPHEERARAERPPLDTFFKLAVSGHASELLEPSVAELAAIGFDEVNVQGIWDAGLEPGTDAIRRIQRVLDW